MPTLTETIECAVQLAAHIGADCAPSYLFWVAENAARKPEDWGFPRSYASRPNWTENVLRREISAVLWRQPTHPSSIPRQYKGLPFRTLAAIADGDIQSLWWDAPTSKIRHEWLCAVACNRRHRATDWQAWLTSPWAWFTRHCPINGFAPRTRLVAEWLVVKKSWAGWQRPLPIGYDANGNMATVNPQDLLDEVWDEDLINGVQSNPERVFRSLILRKTADALACIAAHNAPLPEMPWSEIQGIVQIRTARDLVAEGVRMNHCVGGYVNACKAGRCYILRLPNSTAEITPTGEIYQHSSRTNSQPPAADVALLAKWVNQRKTK